MWNVFSHGTMYGTPWVSKVMGDFAPNPLLLINGLKHHAPKEKPSRNFQAVENEAFSPLPRPPICKAGSYYLAGMSQDASNTERSALTI